MCKIKKKKKRCLCFVQPWSAEQIKTCTHEGEKKNTPNYVEGGRKKKIRKERNLRKETCLSYFWNYDRCRKKKI